MNSTMKGALAILVGLMAAVFFWQPLSAIFSKSSITNDFVLQTAHGTLDSRSLRGKVLAIVFGYASCGSPCAERLGKAVKAYEMLNAGERSQVRMVLVSVDPEHDTPARIADYAKTIHADFIGATGSPEQIRAMADAFAADYVQHTLADGGYVVETRPVIYIVAPDGRFVSVLNAAIPTETAAAALRARLPPQQLPPGN